MRLPSSLAFEKDREILFQRFMLRQDIIFLRYSTIILNVFNVLFLVMDYYRVDDFFYSVLIRGIFFLLLSIFCWLTYTRWMTSNSVQYILVVIYLLLMVSIFLFDHLVLLPSYTLPNISTVFIVSTSILTGVRFRFSVGLNTFLLVVFFVNIPFSHHGEYYLSQMPSLFFIYLISMVGAWLMERNRRGLFLKQLDLRKSHKRLYEQKVRLEEESKLRNILISIMSHDFISPLDAIRSLFHLEDNKVLSPEESKEYRANIDHALDSNVELVRNLVKWSKSQLNGFNVQPKLFSLPDLVEKTIQPMWNNLRRKSLKVLNEIYGHYYVYADPDMLVLVIRNIFSNAIKYSPEGGTIWLGVKKEGEGITFWIKDEGKGMSAERMAKLFHIGQSVEGTHQEKGSGIGLYLSREFLERNGGTMAVDSIEGRGSTFKVTLPFVPKVIIGG